MSMSEFSVSICNDDCSNAVIVVVVVVVIVVVIVVVVAVAVVVIVVSGIDQFLML